MDHLKGSLVLDLIPLCAIMILIWLGVCLERVIVRKTRGTDEPPWPAENDNRFHVGRHMLDGVYSKDDRRYIETKLLDHDRAAERLAYHAACLGDQWERNLCFQLF